MFGRTDRAKDALLDPSCHAAQDCIDELASVLESFEFRQTAAGRGRSSEDLHWERLSLALARCSPDGLADCESARLRQYAARTADQRFGSALAAAEEMQRHSVKDFCHSDRESLRFRPFRRESGGLFRRVFVRRRCASSTCSLASSTCAGRIFPAARAAGVGRIRS